ncbi:MAG: hypothetical protein EAZ73_14045 [Oscillatoriales cyanobacterium]|nr:MAG: hypothetical protein EAZ73_14045 [Oscillatoriales cyanobacterium]
MSITLSAWLLGSRINGNTCISLGIPKVKAAGDFASGFYFYLLRRTKRKQYQSEKELLQLLAL